MEASSFNTITDNYTALQNVAVAFSGYGIFLYNNSSYNVIANNRSESNVSVNLYLYTACHFNRIEENILRFGSSSGMLVSDCTGAIIVGNRVEAAGSVGISLSGIADFGHYLAKNTVVGSGQSGFQMGNAVGCTLVQNTADSNGLWAFVFDNVSHTNVIAKNNIAGSATWPDSCVRNNTVYAYDL